MHTNIVSKFKNPTQCQLFCACLLFLHRVSPSWVSPEDTQVAATHMVHTNNTGSPSVHVLLTMDL